MTLIYIIGFLLCSSLYFPESNGEKLCKIGEDLCSRQCYNPQKFKCIGQGESGTLSSAKLCGHNELICARNRSSSPICYDPIFDECHLTKTREKICAKGESLCPTSFLSCYNPQLQVCLTDERSKNPYYVVCYLGQKICDRNCYYPQTHNCLR